MADEETQQSPDASPFWRRKPGGAWRRRLAAASDRRAAAPAQAQAASEHPGVHETLRTLPVLLDGASLPSGVVELLIEDFEAPTRQLFDIHDGRVSLVEPGQCVPWASIAGTPTAWALALGAQRDTTRLQLTGDERLARCVLAALPRHA